VEKRRLSAKEVLQDIRSDPKNGDTRDPKNNFALAGLILGIVSVFFYVIGIIPILAIIFSGIGLSRTKIYNGAGKQPASIGLVLGIVFTIMYLIAYGHIPVSGLRSDVRMGQSLVPEQDRQERMSSKDYISQDTNQMSNDESSMTPEQSFRAAINMSRSSPLIMAAHQGSMETVRKIVLEKPLDFRDWAVALMKASSEGHVDVVEFLLSGLGATDNINCEDQSGRTALIFAAQNGRTAVVRLLLRKGASVEHRDVFRGTALKYALQGNHAEIVQMLLGRGARN
jgi:hypothetical protein